MTTPDVVRAHRHSSCHQEELRASEQCGCFYCHKIFRPDEITEWCDAAESTALCPYCGVDAVIGSESGYPITEKFLTAMGEYWFGEEFAAEPPVRDDTICEHYSPERCGCGCEGDDNTIVHHPDGTVTVPADQSLLGMVLGQVSKPRPSDG